MKGNLQWITSKFLPVRGSFIVFLIRKRRKVELTKETFTHTNSDRVTQFIYKTPIQNNDLWGQIIIISHLRNYRITVASLIVSIKNNKAVKKQQEAEKHYRFKLFSFRCACARSDLRTDECEYKNNSHLPVSKLHFRTISQWAIQSMNSLKLHVKNSAKVIVHAIYYPKIYAVIIVYAAGNKYIICAYVH